jgi:hypothetical protein
MVCEAWGAAGPARAETFAGFFAADCRVSERERACAGKRESEIESESESESENERGERERESKSESESESECERQREGTTQMDLFCIPTDGFILY